MTIRLPTRTSSATGTAAQATRTVPTEPRATRRMRPTSAGQAAALSRIRAFFAAPNRKRDTRMPRSLWTGSISFGLVNVPVRLYSAVSEHKLQFHFVHEKDSSPIGYQKICKKEGKPVPDDEVVKAFEYR